MDLNIRKMTNHPPSPGIERQNKNKKNVYNVQQLPTFRILNGIVNHINPRMSTLIYKYTAGAGLFNMDIKIYSRASSRYEIATLLSELINYYLRKSR